jgi:general secretion pathway protein F
MRYLAKAIDKHQGVHVVTLDALSEAELSAKLADQGLSLVSARAKDATFSLSTMLQLRSSPLDLYVFAQELQALTAAGLSITEVMEVLIERATSDETLLILQRLHNDIRQGRRLSEALSQQPQVFPPLFVGIVQSAEDTSDLPRAMQRFVAYESQVNAIKHKLVSAAIYPAILLTVGGGVGLFLMGYVVPKFAAVYQDSGRPLPWSSSVLMHVGQWLGEHGMLVMGLLVGLALLGLMAARKSIRSGEAWRLAKHVPGAAPRLNQLDLSRLYLTLGMLLEGGMPLVRAMQLAGGVLPKERLAAWQAVQRLVEQGEGFSSSMQTHQFVTPISSRMMRVGERSGQLGLMLDRSAAFQDLETTRWIERFTRSFEPMLMAAIGLLIGVIVVLLYMPIFDLAGSLP